MAPAPVDREAAGGCVRDAGQGVDESWDLNPSPVAPEICRRPLHMASALVLLAPFYLQFPRDRSAQWLTSRKEPSILASDIPQPGLRCTALWPRTKQPY